MHVVFIVFLSGVCLSICPMVSRAQGTDGRCSRQVSRSITYTETYQTSSTQKYYVKCGFFNWGTCTKYRISYSTSTRPATRIAYATEYQCCAGWTDIGELCVPTTPPPTSPPITPTTPPTRRWTGTLSSGKPVTDIPSSPTGAEAVPPATQSNKAAWTTASVGVSVSVGVDDGSGRAKGQSSLLENRTMMMAVGVLGISVFLALSIGGVFCAVRKLCPRKKQRATRLQNRSSIKSTSSGGDQTNGAAPGNGEVHAARPKHKRRPKGAKGHVFAASNPSYNMVAMHDDANTYQDIDAVDGEQGHAKPLSALPLPGKGTPFSKSRCTDTNETVHENAYVALDEESMAPAIPSRPGETFAKHTSVIDARSTEPSPRKKPMPMPMTKKPAHKPRKDIHQHVNEVQDALPPSAINHLVVPAIRKAPYLDMSNGRRGSDQTETSSPVMPTAAKRIPDDRGIESPKVPRKPNMFKTPSMDVPSDPKNDTSDGYPPKITRPDDLCPTTDVTYDVVTDRSNLFPRASEARLVSPTEGYYVLPGTVTPGSTDSGADDTDLDACTYLAGDDMPGVFRPTSVLNDNPIISPGSSVQNIATESDNNLYDLVGVPDSKRHSVLSNNVTAISRLGYATPRQTSFEDCPYENQKRLSMSLPQKGKQSLPLPHLDTDVYDIVEVKDRMPTTPTTKPKPCIKPKVSPRKPALKSSPSHEVGPQKTRTAVERTTSGPALLRNGQMDSVYMNTSRY